MSIADAIADNTPFLDLNGFAEAIDVYPQGTGTGKPVTQNVLAIVDRSALPGTNEVTGDGVAKLNGMRGRGFRESITIEASTAVNIPVDGNCVLGITKPGTTTKEFWGVKRCIGRDEGLSAYIATRNVDQQIRKSERRG